MINKERMTTISDGIIAVAATVMVLRLDIPEQVSAAAIAERVPTLIAYVISYIQIFLAWHEHHDALVKAEKINHRIFLMNTLWLFFITMMPFVTGVVGNSPNHTPTIGLLISNRRPAMNVYKNEESMDIVRTMADKVDEIAIRTAGPVNMIALITEAKKWRTLQNALEKEFLRPKRSGTDGGN